MFVTFLSKLFILSIKALFVSKILACSSIPVSNFSKATFTPSTFSAKKIAQESLKIASGLCIYTNDSISVIEIT